MVLFQGPTSALPGTAVTGSIFFALDTGTLYWASGGSWEVLSEELTGDVTKPANSTVTSLANVFLSPGTYGSSNQVPRLTVDSKGRIVGLTLEDIVPATPGAAGSNGQLQFNSNGVLGGTPGITFNNGVLSYANKTDNFDNLSPLTTKGDVLAHNGTDNVRVAAGSDGQYLAADSTAAAGVRWVSPSEVEVRFFFGDATPKPLVTVPANKVVNEVLLTIITPLNDPAATLSVEPGLLATTDNLPSVSGSYGSVPGVEFASPTLLTLNISPGTSTQGMGVVTINFAS
jgi:hypothetical protein